MDKKWNGSWIKEARFAELLPLNVYHKEREAAPPHHHDEELKNFHMLVRKEFVLTDAYKKALLNITADDYYKLYINGRFVGQGPAQGNYYHYYYNKYDVVSFLKEGTNVIAVHVYYQGLVCRAYNSGDYRQGMIAELEVDGKLIVKSDQTWLSRKANEYISGGIVGYNTQYLEWIDSREQVPDWRNASIDLSGWKSCEEMEDHEYSLFLQPTPPVSVYEIKPQHISALMFEHADEVLVNTTRVQGLNGTDVEDLTEAEELGRKQVLMVAEFMKNRLPFFEKAAISSVGAQIAVRETRRIDGVYALQVEDVVQGRRFEDVIARSDYSIDIHDPSGKGVTATWVKGDGTYDIPYRCLLSAAQKGYLPDAAYLPRSPCHHSFNALHGNRDVCRALFYSTALR
ncbi:FAD-dependent oxidoreductase [Paenibacillus phytorum]|uniref:FAD-dependent oxidoreductase n=1 Tax=Paenibacillus phytorum TaxID=2654977 RepID=UPI0028AE28A8|nr:FAD-dependent oxidoreductase [Paenibacillus phytorum]